MKAILNILMCMCLFFSQMQPLLPVANKLKSSISQESNVSEQGNVTDSTVPSTESTETYNTESPEETVDTGSSVVASNFATLDLEGYCTLNVPMSHFTINEDNSTTTYKQIDYLDNKTRVYMSYVTDMDKSADIPGYIAKEAAGVNTVTNDKTDESYGNYSWVKIKADHQEDECNIYIYYTLNKDGTSAFWVKAKVAVESDDDKFDDIMRQMLSTYYLYATSGTVFKTPTTGIYKDMDNDSTKADTSDYEANSDKNNVFKSRGGFVVGAKISDDWKDLQIILDDVKYSLPSKVSKFEKHGYKLNDLAAEASGVKESMKVPRCAVKTLTYKNDNGTVVKLTVYNDNAKKVKNFKDCPVVGIIVDADKFVDVTATDKEEVYNEETSETDMAAKNAKDDYNHELILPGGITWGAYGDDLKSYYGVCTEGNYTPEIPMYTWKSGDSKMIIRTDMVHTIRYVQLLCMSLDDVTDASN